MITWNLMIQAKIYKTAYHLKKKVDNVILIKNYH